MKLEEIISLKGKRRITMLTAYDYPLSSLIDKAGIDMILVGDSLANVVLGLESTTEVTMEQMLYHAKAVRRAARNAFIVGDLPYESYQLNPEDSVKAAERFMREAGCDAVKLEWFDKCPEAVEKIIKTGIPVMGHIGLTPQTAQAEGGFKVRGKDAEAAKRLIEQAGHLERLGCFAVVLECVPDRIAELITKKIKILTIGIGAGARCDGQVLVTYDMLGLFERWTPKFVKKYVNLSALISQAVIQYKEEVVQGKFPAAEHSFTIKEEELRKLRA